jgi:putative hydrolase of the HAD superfamily
VIGDDLHSEIKAAQDLGIDTILYDKFNLPPDDNSLERINDFSALKYFL